METLNENELTNQNELTNKKIKFFIPLICHNQKQMDGS